MMDVRRDGAIADGPPAPHDPARNVWCSEPVLRGVSTLVGGGFLLYALIAASTGSFDDSDEGWIERASRPVACWASIVGTTFLGLLILGVGYQWPVVATLINLFEQRF
jgi:hypothetical protein